MKSVFLITALAFCLAAGPVLADRPGNSSDDSKSAGDKDKPSASGQASQSAANKSAHDQQDEIRAAVRAGKILPLTQILDAVKKKAPGTVIYVELRTQDGCKIYEVDVLTQNGRRVRAEVDATNAKVNSVESR